jgi:hypothetical protein
MIDRNAAVTVGKVNRPIVYSLRISVWVSVQEFLFTASTWIPQVAVRKSSAQVEISSKFMIGKVSKVAGWR